MRHRSGISKAALGLLLACSCMLLFINFVNVTGPTYFTWRGQQVVSSTSIESRGGFIQIIERTTHSSNSPSWPTQVFLRPFLTRSSCLANRLDKIHSTSSPAYIMDTCSMLAIWPLVGLFAVYPAIVFIVRPLRRQRLRRHNKCASCTYDLTGNESGICPECGEIKVV